MSYFEIIAGKLKREEMLFYARFKIDVSNLDMKNYFRGEFEDFDLPKAGDMFQYSNLQNIKINETIGYEQFVINHNWPWHFVIPMAWIENISKEEFNEEDEEEEA